MNEKRVLAVPSTEDPTAPLNRRQKLGDEYLEKAIEVVKNTMEGVDPKLAYDAAKWVAEMVMGKPKQEIEQTVSVETEMARMLGMAYAEHLKGQSALPPVRDGEIRILGGPQPTDEVPEEPITVEGTVIDITPRPHKPRSWDALPE